MNEQTHVPCNWSMQSAGAADLADAGERAEFAPINAPPQGATGARNTGGGTNTKPRHENKPHGLSDEDLRDMYSKGEGAGIAREKIDAWIARRYGQRDPHNLTFWQYEEICFVLDEEIRKIRKEPSIWQI